MKSVSKFHLVPFNPDLFLLRLYSYTTATPATEWKVHVENYFRRFLEKIK